MSPWVPRIIILACLAVILGLPLLWRPTETHETVGSSDLVVITPHNEQIRHEVGRAFSLWHAEQFGTPIRIDWRVIGGSSDVLRLLTSQYEALAAENAEDRGTGYDVVFGGGDYLFDKKLKKGVTVTTRDGGKRQVSITLPIAFDEAFIREVFPTQTIADRPLYDPDGHWWGVVLTSFGIVYNEDVLKLLDLPPPKRWHDMADPRFFGWIALTDPSHSGSVRVTYEAILCRFGWDEGWPLLRRLCANSRYFAFSSSQVPIDVSVGEAAAGMSIDFYGRFQAQQVGEQRSRYIAPIGETVVNADPVAVLRGAPHRELAERFVRFLLSERGQVLWDARIGDRLGPERFELRRSPARRDVYAKYHDRLIDAENPFEVAKPMPEGAPTYFDVLPIILHAMAMDVHDELQAAWQAVYNENDPQVRERMLALFDELPFTPAQIAEAPSRWKADPRTQTEDRLAWTRFFLDRYRRVADLAATRLSLSEPRP